MMCFLYFVQGSISIHEWNLARDFEHRFRLTPVSNTKLKPDSNESGVMGTAV